MIVVIVMAESTLFFVNESNADEVKIDYKYLVSHELLYW